MIPLWLTPKVIKGSIIGLICLAIFFAGYSLCAKIKAGKIEKLKAEYSILENNNRQCLDQNARAFLSIGGLEAAITAQNAAFDQLAADSASELTKQALRARLALEAYQRATQESGAVLEAEKAALLERMALLTATESCHEAWNEVVK